jgi:hypothetical protein
VDIFVVSVVLWVVRDNDTAVVAVAASSMTD